MTAQQESSSEPSIEEILDSIRQIISDEEEGGGEATTAPSAPPPAPPQKAAPKADEDVIELTNRAPEEPKPAPPPPPPVSKPSEFEKEVMQVDMQEMEPEPEPAPPPPRPEPRPASKSAYDQQETRPAMTSDPQSSDSLEGILTRGAENAALNAFSELAQKAAIEKGGKVTIEDVVRYEVRPLLRAWVDKHLPGIVERLLQKELERIARRFEED